ncbi:MAG TPA: D-alanyl-D-alanine carboxypeptidase family protein, partial [Burkholderiales bacterium]|nr:D-alanyl-D-alanine carboxypeptidase family protein [Burkholderiales bacterium]
QVLAARNAETPAPPASLTKLAVAYVLFQRLRERSLALGDRVNISARAADTKGASMFLRPNEQLSVEELLKGMIVVSANDAAVALAEHVAGSEPAFVALMNSAVRAIGLLHTQFVSTNGLPTVGHVSSAHDLARLTTALMRDFPQYYSWFSTKDFTHNGIRQYNRNALLWRDPSADGVKTGHTREAGYCLIGSAKRNGMRLIAVVLGAADENARFIAAQQLFDFGFRHFETRLLYSARTAITEVRVWMGDQSALPLGPARDLYLTLPRGWHERARVRLTVKQDQTAPVRLDQSVGLLAVDLDSDAIVEYPLIALNGIDRGNVFQRTADHMRRWFR